MGLREKKQHGLLLKRQNDHIWNSDQGHMYSDPYEGLMQDMCLPLGKKPKKMTEAE